MFLLRSAFWLSIAILLIPADPETGTEAPRVTAIEAFVAARATIADMSAFCDRNPDVCVTGSAAWQLFTEKAENGARMLYRLFDRPPAPAGEPGREASNGTLTPADMAPPWRGPGSDGAA
jgi:hypothetical protein